MTPPPPPAGQSGPWETSRPGKKTAKGKRERKQPTAAQAQASKNSFAALAGSESAESSQAGLRQEAISNPSGQGQVGVDIDQVTDSVKAVTVTEETANETAEDGQNPEMEDAQTSNMDIDDALPEAKRFKVAMPSSDQPDQPRPRRTLDGVLARARAKANRGRASTSEQPADPVARNEPIFQRPSHQGSLIAQMEEAQSSTKIDFQAMMELKGPKPRVVIMTNSRSSGMRPRPIGLLTKDHDSWSARLLGSSGRFGEPVLQLSFTINHPRLGKRQLTLRWRPGVKVATGGCQIEKMDFNPYDKFKQDHNVTQPHLLEGLSDTQRQRLLVVRFLHRSCFQSSTISRQEIEEVGLDPMVMQTLIHLHNSSESCGVTLWFLSPCALDLLTSRYLGPLQAFVNEAIPPFAQYLNEKGRIIHNWGKLPLIEHIGGGMYILNKRKTGGPANFYQFPARTVFEINIEWQLSVIVPVIRNVQWAKAQLSHLEERTMLLLIVDTEKVSVPGISKPLGVPGDWYGLIRIKPIEGRIGKVPDRGTMIHIDIDNAELGMPHTPTPKARRLKGRVIKNEGLCRSTGTHFCVLLTKPKGLPKEIQPSPDRYHVDGKLLRVWLEVGLDTTSASRELSAAITLTTEGPEPHVLDKYRMAFKSPLAAMPGNIDDLSAHDPQLWQEYLQEKLPKCADNPSQEAVLMSITNVKDGMVVVAGPPGAGKTKILVEIILGLCAMDDKVLVVGPSNAAVNKDAMETFKAYGQTRLMDKLVTKYFIRLEVSGVELRAMVRVKDYLTNSNEDTLDSLPDVVELDSIENDPDVADALEAAVNSFEENDEAFQKFVAQLSDWDAALARFKEEQSRKDISVPRVMTTGHHLFLLCTWDEKAAVEAWAYLQEALLDPAKSEEEITQYEEDYGSITDELWQALKADAITQEVIDERVASGVLKSAAGRDASYEYRKVQLSYIAKKGKLDREEMHTFREQWAKQLQRVLEYVDVIFTTCNNSGSDLLKMGFNADVLLVDEAGQVNLSSMAIPLTVSDKLRATWFFGDYKQLPPTDFAAGFNEFHEHSKMSAIAFFEEKGLNILRLNMQYRMCPAISQFPAKYFYKGNLKDHPSVIPDTYFRHVFRWVTMRHYGMRARDGSELIGIDVRKGRSVAEEQGTSAYNVANAMAIAEFAIRLLSEDDDFRVENIVILVYYQAQIAYIEKYLREKAQDDDMRSKVAKLSIFTVDKYQGEECQIVLLDTTVSKPYTFMGSQGKDRKGGHAKQDAADEPTGPPVFNLSPHVKSAGRICCAITRARAGLAIFCNYDTCVSLLKSGTADDTRALGEVMLDLHKRDLIYHDEVTIENDLSPEDMKRRMRENESAVVRNAKNMRFMNQSFKRVRSKGKGKAPEKVDHDDDDDDDVAAADDDDFDKDPWANVDPNIDPNIDPDVDLEIDPNVDPNVDPDVDLEIDPDVDLDFDLEDAITYE